MWPTFCVGQVVSVAAMYEYKTINIGVPYLEAQLNELARHGWRVVASYAQHSKISPTIILERQKTGVVRD